MGGASASPAAHGVAVEVGGKRTVLYRPFPHQVAYHESQAKHFLLEGGAGSGKSKCMRWDAYMRCLAIPRYRALILRRSVPELRKALALDTEVPTPDGWRTMRDLQVGDAVFSEDGSPTTIVGKSDPLIDPRGTFRVTFDNGESVVTSAGHQWSVSIRTRGRRNKRLTATTEHMASTVRSEADQRCRYAVPVAGAWKMDADVDLPIAPYTYGAWLGDGTSNFGEITGIDQDVFDGIRAEGYAVIRRPSKLYAYGIHGLQRPLRLNGLGDKRRVPPEYFRGSYAQRLALLQGLMDTDGWCQEGGWAGFCQEDKRKHLADTVFRLAASLGLKPAQRSRRVKGTGFAKRDFTVHEVGWGGDVPVFQIRRKRERLKPLREASRAKWHYITNVERVEDVVCQCIEVDHPSHQYLVTRASIPTHNSHLAEVPFEAKQLGLADDAWHSTNFILRFPNGSTLEFGHCEDEQSLSKYLSSEYELIVFDELATFTHRQFKFLSSRARTTKKGVRPIIRGGTNPVGVGAPWVKRYFITKNVSPDEDPEYHPEDYAALKCTMFDNPALDQADYKKTLAGLPSDALRRAMLYGEWVIEGQFFSEWAPTKDGREWHVIAKMPTLKGVEIHRVPWIEIVRVLDWGYAASGNPGVCLWFACLEDGSAICFREYVFKETLPRDVAAEIKRLSADVKVRYTVGDTAMWQEHEGPSIAEQLSVHGLSMVEADKARVPGWVEVHTWLRDTVTTGTIVTPRMRFWADGCPHTIKTLPEMVIDPKDANDIITAGVEDDAADCVRYFVMSRPGRSRPPKQDGRLAWMWKQVGKKRPKFDRLGSEARRRG